MRKWHSEKDEDWPEAARKSPIETGNSCIAQYQLYYHSICYDNAVCTRDIQPFQLSSEARATEASVARIVGHEVTGCVDREIPV